MCLAIQGRVIEISSDNQDSALVDVVGVRRRIDLGLLQDDRPVPGDWVLIHVGFAMSKISEEDATDQMNTLRMLGEVEGAVVVGGEAGDLRGWTERAAVDGEQDQREDEREHEQRPLAERPGDRAVSFRKRAVGYTTNSAAADDLPVLVL